MILALGRYYISLHYWNSRPDPAILRMQLRKFANLFELARRKSKFYREYYGDHGVLDLKIRSLDDVRRVPIVTKALLKAQAVTDIMTRGMGRDVNVHSTSGSSGEPFRIAIEKGEDYTAHARVFWALRRAGYRPRDRIVMVTRYGAGDTFGIERDISVIGRIQRRLGLFRRDIVSIYEPADTIIAALQKTDARVLWSTPSIMQIVCQRLAQRDLRLHFPIVFFTSEVIAPQQKALFHARLGKHIVNLYGAMESPSLGFDFGLTDRFLVMPNSNLFEFEDAGATDDGPRLGRVVITNLINRTMPFIRYDLEDLAEVDERPGSARRFIGRVLGRRDDIVDLGQGRKLAHHHAYEMFRDFHECAMYKFLQRRDGALVLQLVAAPGHDRQRVEMSARERWEKRYAGIPLRVEFVDGFSVNMNTGKFKNIERAG
jgi:phenylacetate-CoA ligase